MQSLAKIWFLKRIHLLDDLGPEAMEIIDERTRMLQVPRRGEVFCPGEPADSVYLLKSGRIKLSRPQGSHDLTLAILEPGEVFGALAALSGSDYDTRAEVLEDAALCVIRRPDFEALLAQQPALSLKLTKLIGLRLKRIEIRAASLLYADVPQRLASVLLELAETMGAAEPDGVCIKPHLTHKELAGLIASTRETVSLTLGQFRERGLVNFDRRRLAITDRDGLSALCFPAAGQNTDIT